MLGGPGEQIMVMDGGLDQWSEERRLEKWYLLPMLRLPSSSSGVAALKYFTKCSSCEAVRERESVSF